MVCVNPTLCCTCGSCVSVCPRGALVLDETRLSVSDDCTDCGLCVPACPVAALTLGVENTSCFTPSKFGSAYDVVVVGGGPAGSTAAYTSAKLGLSVLLLEKRQEIGSPVRCAEGVAKAQLLEFIEPDSGWSSAPAWISASVNRAKITAVGNGSSATVTAEGGEGYILDSHRPDEGPRHCARRHRGPWAGGQTGIGSSGDRR